jgi:5-hydroxyisourate hydrolase
MSPITTHVIDTAAGQPAVGVPVTLEFLDATVWTRVGAGVTDFDGRCPALVFADYKLSAGQYRITFDTSAYFADQPTFYPSVTVIFVIYDASSHYHVPLLLSPYGYSTYRGS